MKASDLTARHARQQLAGIVRIDELSDEAIVDRWSRAVWSHLVEPGDGIAGRLIESLGAEAALRTLLAGPRAISWVDCRCGSSPKRGSGGSRGWPPIR